MTALFGFFLAAAAAATPAPLGERLAQGPDGWVAYRMPLVEGADAPCCFGDRDASATVCDLDARHLNFGSRFDHAAPTGPQDLNVYLHRRHGEIDRVRAFAASCAVSTTVSFLDGVEPAASAQWLGQWSARHAERHSEGELGLAALAYQAGAEATQALVTLSAPDAPREQRKNALFWLGQTRGREGAAAVERAARSDADPAVREHAVFALSQSKAVDGYAAIQDIARHDASEQVRGQALFWMAQTGDARASADIRAALDIETSAHVREQAVFALSQLHPGGDAALIALLRSDAPREVKQKAMFWLGQSGSDEAIAFLDRVLTESQARH
jgi:hypothetical protein